MFLRAFRIFPRLFLILDSDFFWQDLTVAETFYRSTNLDRPGDFFEALNSRSTIRHTGWPAWFQFMWRWILGQYSEPYDTQGARLKSKDIYRRPAWFQFMWRWILGQYSQPYDTQGARLKSKDIYLASLGFKKPRIQEGIHYTVQGVRAARHVNLVVADFAVERLASCPQSVGSSLERPNARAR